MRMPTNVAKLPTRSEALWIVSAISAVLPVRYARNPFPNIVIKFSKKEYIAIRALVGMLMALTPFKYGE